MTRDRLYEAAFRYKKAKIWRMLWDNDVFAVKLKSGDIGYVSIMGRNREYNALGLYIGQEGFESYRRMTDMSRFSGVELRDRELLLRQKCLQTALENKEGLMPEEVDEVRVYARKHGIRLSGKNTFPQFIKYEPGCHPWKVRTQEDMDALFEGMEAAILLADMLGDTKPEGLGIMPIGPDTDEVPLFAVERGKLVSKGRAPLPGMPKETYVYAKAENQIAIASMKKLPKRGVWESELLRLPEAVQEAPGETPFYPLFLMVVEQGSRFTLPVSLLGRDETNTQAMLQAFAAAWKECKVYPKEIRCRDERTYALLKDFCEKTGVKIKLYDGKMPTLDEAEAAFWEQISGMDDPASDRPIADLLESFLSLDDEELRSLPKEIVGQLRMILAQGVLPEEVAAVMEKKLKGL